MVTVSFPLGLPMARIQRHFAAGSKSLKTFTDEQLRFMVGYQRCFAYCQRRDQCENPNYVDSCEKPN